MISIAKVMPLYNSSCMLFAMFLIVHILCNQHLLEPSVYSFSTLQECYRYIEDVHEEV